MKSTVEISLDKLQSYIEAESYKGYDPYDTLTSFIPFVKIHRWLAIIVTQIQKRNPINIRPLLGIKKEYNPKGLGLMLHAYCILQKKNPTVSYENQINLLINLIKELSTKGYQGICWGYNFGWCSPEKYLKPYSPTAVATAFIVKGFYEAYKLNPSDDLKNIILSASDFVLSDLAFTEDESGICYSYSTEKKDICYNASLLAGEILAINYSITRNEYIRIKCHQIVNYVVDKQHVDGHWAYSKDSTNGNERTQTDFHQGFVLESISNIVNHCKITDEKIDYAINMGCKYYLLEQFEPNGRSLFRIPKKYPTDIHYQAQGIITLCRLKNSSVEMHSFAKTIAEWTINNMQSKNGYFYYRVYKLFKDKTSYIRWGQAWMFLALAELTEDKS
ncbi:MAG: delta-aminolevulinic acid dehydratase [Bacteroidota bacterium]